MRTKKATRFAIPERSHTASRVSEATRAERDTSFAETNADAATFEQTDWPQIVALYDQLLALAPTPVVALNRAIAVGELQGPAAALAPVDDLDLDSYHAFRATRADLLRRLGRNNEAAAAYERAAALAPTDAARNDTPACSRTGACLRHSAPC